MLNPLFAAAVRVQEFCSARKWRTCYIGGISVQRWAEQRQTKEEPQNEEKLQELMKREGLL